MSKRVVSPSSRAVVTATVSNTAPAADSIFVCIRVRSIPQRDADTDDDDLAHTRSTLNSTSATYLNLAQNTISVSVLDNTIAVHDPKLLSQTNIADVISADLQKLSNRAADPSSASATLNSSLACMTFDSCCVSMPKSQMMEMPLIKYSDFLTADNVLNSSSVSSRSTSPSRATTRFASPNRAGRLRGSQFEVYENTAAHAVSSVLDGFNACVFGYGQTGSGKTYTMFGGDTSNLSGYEPGIVPRSFFDLFTQLERKKLNFETEHNQGRVSNAAEIERHTLNACDNEWLSSNGAFADSEMAHFHYEIKIGFLEIYQKEVGCLLSKKGNLNVREGKEGGPYVEDLRVTVVKSADEAIRLVETGLRRRRTGSTRMNSESSRSHAILQVFVKQTAHGGRGKQTSVLSSMLNLVDLAGSERQKTAATNGVATKEGTDINLSLSHLARVINEVSAASNHPTGNQYVNYRGSKLTHLLKESLGGNCRTFMIAAVSPTAECVQETISTLKYARSVQNIRNKPTINKKLQMRADLQDEVATLKQELQDARRQLELLTLMQISGASNDTGVHASECQTLAEMVSNGIIDTENHLARLSHKECFDSENLAMLDDDHNSRSSSWLSGPSSKTQSIRISSQRISDQTINHTQLLQNTRSSTQMASNNGLGTVTNHPIILTATTTTTTINTVDEPADATSAFHRTSTSCSVPSKVHKTGIAAFKPSEDELDPIWTTTAGPLIFEALPQRATQNLATAVYDTTFWAMIDPNIRRKTIRNTIGSVNGIQMPVTLEEEVEVHVWCNNSSEEVSLDTRIKLYHGSVLRAEIIKTVTSSTGASTESVETVMMHFIDSFLVTSSASEMLHQHRSLSGTAASSLNNSRAPSMLRKMATAIPKSRSLSNPSICSEENTDEVLETGSEVNSRRPSASVTHCRPQIVPRLFLNNLANLSKMINDDIAKAAAAQSGNDAEGSMLHASESSRDNSNTNSNVTTAAVGHDNVQREQSANSDATDLFMEEQDADDEQVHQTAPRGSDGSSASEGLGFDQTIAADFFHRQDARPSMGSPDNQGVLAPQPMTNSNRVSAHGFELPPSSPFSRGTRTPLNGRSISGSPISIPLAASPNCCSNKNDNDAVVAPTDTQINKRSTSAADGHIVAAATINGVPSSVFIPRLPLAQLQREASKLIELVQRQEDQLEYAYFKRSLSSNYAKETEENADALYHSPDSTAEEADFTSIEASPVMAELEAEVTRDNEAEVDHNRPQSIVLESVVNRNREARSPIVMQPEEEPRDTVRSILKSQARRSQSTASRRAVSIVDHYHVDAARHQQLVDELARVTAELMRRDGTVDELRTTIAAMRVEGKMWAEALEKEEQVRLSMEAEDIRMTQKMDDHVLHEEKNETVAVEEDAPMAARTEASQLAVTEHTAQTQHHSPTYESLEASAFTGSVNVLLNSALSACKMYPPTTTTTTTAFEDIELPNRSAIDASPNAEPITSGQTPEARNLNQSAQLHSNCSPSPRRKYHDFTTMGARQLVVATKADSVCHNGTSTARAYSVATSHRQRSVTADEIRKVIDDCKEIAELRAANESLAMSEKMLKNQVANLTILVEELQEESNEAVETAVLHNEQLFQRSKEISMLCVRLDAAESLLSSELEASEELRSMLGAAVPAATLEAIQIKLVQTKALCDQWRRRWALKNLAKSAGNDVAPVNPNILLEGDKETLEALVFELETTLAEIKTERDSMVYECENLKNAVENTSEQLCSKTNEVIELRSILTNLQEELQARTTELESAIANNSNNSNKRQVGKHIQETKELITVRDQLRKTEIELSTAKARETELAKRLKDTLDRKQQLTAPQSNASLISSVELRKQLESKDAALSYAGAETKVLQAELKVISHELMLSFDVDIDGDKSTPANYAYLAQADACKKILERVVARLDEAKSISGIETVEDHATVRLALRLLVNQLKATPLFLLNKNVAQKIQELSSQVIVANRCDSLLTSSLSDLKNAISEMESKTIDSNAPLTHKAAIKVKPTFPGARWALTKEGIADYFMVSTPNAGYPADKRRRQLIVAHSLISLSVWYDHFELSAKNNFADYCEIARNGDYLIEIANAVNGALHSDDVSSSKKKTLNVVLPPTTVEDKVFISQVKKQMGKFRDRNLFTLGPKKVITSSATVTTSLNSQTVLSAAETALSAEVKTISDSILEEATLARATSRAASVAVTSQQQSLPRESSVPFLFTSPLSEKPICLRYERSYLEDLGIELDDCVAKAKSVSMAASNIDQQQHFREEAEASSDDAESNAAGLQDNDEAASPTIDPIQVSCVSQIFEHGISGVQLFSEGENEVVVSEVPTTRQTVDEAEVKNQLEEIAQLAEYFRNTDDVSDVEDGEDTDNNDIEPTKPVDSARSTLNSRSAGSTIRGSNTSDKVTAAFMDAQLAELHRQIAGDADCMLMPMNGPFTSVTGAQPLAANPFGRISTGSSSVQLVMAKMEQLDPHNNIGRRSSNASASSFSEAPPTSRATISSVPSTPQVSCQRFKSPPPPQQIIASKKQIEAAPEKKSIVPETAPPSNKGFSFGFMTPAKKLLMMMKGNTAAATTPQTSNSAMKSTLEASSPIPVPPQHKTNVIRSDNNVRQRLSTSRPSAKVLEAEDRLLLRELQGARNIISATSPAATQETNFEDPFTVYPHKHVNAFEANEYAEVLNSSPFMANFSAASPFNRKQGKSTRKVHNTAVDLFGDPSKENTSGSPNTKVDFGGNPFGSGRVSSTIEMDKAIGATPQQQTLRWSGMPSSVHNRQ